MSWLTRILGRKSATTLDLFRELFGGWGSETGESVTVERALAVTTVLAILRVGGNGVAQVPWQLRKESADGKSRPLAKDKLLFEVMRRKPNKWMTSFQLRRLLMDHYLLVGEAHCWINWIRNRTEVAELIPFQAGTVTTIQNDDYSLTYRVRGKNGSTRDFVQGDVWHLRNISWNGFTGLPVVKLAREAIGLAIATEKHHARMHRKGRGPGGLISIKDPLSADQHAQMKAWIEQNIGNAASDWETLLLDRGAEYTRFAMTGVDAQHLETRRFQIEELCRAIGGMMPIMVGYSDKAQTYASAEQMFLAHLVHFLSPIYEDIEQSADISLLTDEDRAAGYYTKFQPAGLMRGDSATRAAFYQSGIFTGWMTRNEARRLEDLDDLDGLDEPLVPSNMELIAALSAALADAKKPKPAAAPAP